MAKQRLGTPVVKVGQEWTEEECEIVVESDEEGEPEPPSDSDDIRARRRAQTRLALLLSAFFALLLSVLTIYGMWTSNTRIVEQSFDIAQVGLFASLVWACGPPVLRMIGAIKFTDPK